MDHKETEETLLRKLGGVYSSLSPENLTCDGELSQEEVEARYKELMAEKMDLESRLGRIPTEDECFEALQRDFREKWGQRYSR